MSIAEPQPIPTLPTGAPACRVVLKAADLAVFPRRLPTGDVDYELDDGRLVIVSPPGYRHGRSGSAFVAALVSHGETPGLGVVCDEVGVILRRNPDRVVGPDAAFIATKSLPPRVSPEGYLETIPELIVEIRSKNETMSEVLAKVAEYLAAGAELVWVAEPDSRSVSAYRSDQPPAVFAATDTLTADPVIPNFAVPVAELFRD